MIKAFFLSLSGPPAKIMKDDGDDGSGGRTGRVSCLSFILAALALVSEINSIVWELPKLSL